MMYPLSDEWGSSHSGRPVYGLVGDRRVYACARCWNGIVEGVSRGVHEVRFDLILASLLVSHHLLPDATPHSSAVVT